jgi:hypothetical protein
MAESKSPQIRLPKDALSRIKLGNAFAEYDRILQDNDVFVRTPAIEAALEPSRGKCFFVGRRGTGKTAITYFLAKHRRTAVQIFPAVFSPLGVSLPVDKLRDTRQRPFRSLVASFSRAMLLEVISEWAKKNLLHLNDLPGTLRRERHFVEDFDFDERVLRFVSDIMESLNSNAEKEWLKQVKRVREIETAMSEIREWDTWDYTLLLDRIDESWDGSDTAVIFLMALMHACVEVSAAVGCVQPKLFLRENIFERVREIDNEFARLETSVVSLDWSRDQLLELVERRLNLPFTTKLALRGPTWDHFFEGPGERSRALVFEYCQERPRDVLTYCEFAIESAQARQQERVTIEDLQSARKRFSDSRLKDLGDEYAENYPQIQLVLERFYGLGKEFTVPGIEMFIQKLLVDQQVKELCGRWLFAYTVPDRFMQLLYNIGFIGLKEHDEIVYRALGPRSSTPPPITANTHAVIHPSYADALSLQDVVIHTLESTLELRKAGLLAELPGSIKLNEYHELLEVLQEDLKTLPWGDESASEYERICGEVLRLCFFRSLTNIEPRVRNVSGRVIRDWIASNRASSGFWEMVRTRFDATQIVWECKNYAALDADAFHQVLYYMTSEIGRFAVLSFRGEIKNHYYEHVSRVARQANSGIVLLLTDRDLLTFIRQAINGKTKEDHIQEIYDRTVRLIS